MVPTSCISWDSAKSFRRKLSRRKKFLLKNVVVLSRHPDRQKVLHRNKAIKKGQPEKNSKDTTSSTRQPGLDCHYVTAKKGQSGKESQERTDRKGQPVWEIQKRAARTGRPEQAVTARLRQTTRTKLPGKESQDRTDRKGLPEQPGRQIVTE